jgi:hypothetical protein
MVMRAHMSSAYLAAVGVHGPSTADVVAVTLMVGLGLLAVLVTLIIVFTEPPTDRSDGGDGDSGPGGGGGGPGGRGPDGPESPGGDPVWWPEFERQFADYVTSSSRT